MSDSLRAAAHAYASAGYPVFPCEINGKRPACKHWRDEATTSHAQIDEWWQFKPYNVAIATGTGSIDVLDFDTKEGIERIREAIRVLRDAGMMNGAKAYVRTRSGGLHVWFDGTGQANKAGIGGYPVDFRSSGGYIIAPPSFVENAGYHFIEQSDGNGQFNVGRAEVLLRPPVKPRAAHYDGDREADIDVIAGWLSSVAKEPGRHNHFFRAVCWALTSGHTDLGPLVEVAQKEMGLPDPGEGDYLGRTIRDQIRKH